VDREDILLERATTETQSTYLKQAAEFVKSMYSGAKEPYITVYDE